MTNSTKPTIATLSARIDTLEAQVIALTTQLNVVQLAAAEPQRKGARDYGPSSLNAMTSEIAWRIRYGDLVATPVKDIASTLGLSRGQVYSVRGNYTFTAINEDSYDIVDGKVVAATK